MPLATKVLLCFGTAHFNFALFDLALDFARRAGVHFSRRAAERKCLRLFTEVFFEMIFEIYTVLFLVQGFSILSRLIGHRRDVLYYVSKPDPRW
jgi:hypothetical protein